MPLAPALQTKTLLTNRTLRHPLLSSLESPWNQSRIPLSTPTRAKVKIGVANLAYNFTRLAWLQARAALAWPAYPPGPALFRQGATNGKAPLERRVAGLPPAKVMFFEASRLAQAGLRYGRLICRIYRMVTRLYYTLNKRRSTDGFPNTRRRRT